MGRLTLVILSQAAGTKKWLISRLFESNRAGGGGHPLVDHIFNPSRYRTKHFS